MNSLKSVEQDIIQQMADIIAIGEAINTIKNNPKKYPEFSFFVPGYDCEKWTKDAINLYDRVVCPDLDAPVLFKMIVTRHYRKIRNEWIKAGRDINCEEFGASVATEVKRLHPEYFKNNAQCYH